jgi:anti-anti-sigma regulatory factor
MTTKKRSSKFMLGENLNIGSAEKLHTRMRNCSEKHVDVTVNAEKVMTLDTTVLQLFAAFVQQVRDNGNIVNWYKPSEALIKTVALTGLTTHLNLSKIE